MNVDRELIEKYFRRLHRFERLSNCDAPMSILESELELIEAAQEELTNVGLDVNLWMTTPQGQVEFRTFCATTDHLEKCSARCGQCFEFKYIEHFGCEFSSATPFRCPYFKDSGYYIDDRIHRFMINRCSKCKHHTEHKLANDLGFEINCSKKLDQLAEKCETFEE